MFKKLKDKIAEEVKSSPQRIQQLTQSVSERLQYGSNDESFFSLADDDKAAPELEPGFSNVSLNMASPRKTSVSSLASDVSFLPRYESNTNLYHLQSDLDASASEMEDNASSSSQLGHLSKEQLYAAFRKSQMRYHKYRGRFTDIANHYKELEREVKKMKSVLVETQDKALRRVGELREQCALEQKAKAHLENALRVELDEKQYVIDTLQTKIGLLRAGERNELLLDLPEPSDSSRTLTEVFPNKSDDLDVLTKDLKDARLEIESLNGKLQEAKANSIIFQSKESDYKAKIAELDRNLQERTKETAAVLERERENNLKIAQTKMELHSEMESKELEVLNLKRDVDGFRQELDRYESGAKSNERGVKLENLQSQNSKLIEKIESLTQKGNGYENELIKLEQLKIENKNLSADLAESKRIASVEVERQLEQARVEHERKVDELREGAKLSLLSLEAKIKEKLTAEFEEKEKKLEGDFHARIGELSANRDVEIKLMEIEHELKRTKADLELRTAELNDKTRRFDELERGHLELISENGARRSDVKDLGGEVETALAKLEESEKKNRELTAHISNLNGEFSLLQAVTSNLQNSNQQLAEQVEHHKREVEPHADPAAVERLAEENSALKVTLEAERVALIEIRARFENSQKKLESVQEKLAQFENSYATETTSLWAQIENLKNAEAKSAELVGEIEEIKRAGRERLAQIESEHATETTSLWSQIENLKKFEVKHQELLEINEELRKKNLEFVRVEYERSMETAALWCQIENLKVFEVKHQALLETNEELRKRNLELEQVESERLVETTALWSQIENLKNVEVKHQELLETIENLRKKNSELEQVESERSVETTALWSQIENLKVFEVKHQELLETNEELRKKNSKLEQVESERSVETTALWSQIENLKNIAVKHQELLETIENLRKKNSELEQVESERSVETTALWSQIENLKVFEVKHQELLETNEDLRKKVSELEQVENERSVETTALWSQIENLKVFEVNHQELLETNENLRKKISELEQVESERSVETTALWSQIENLKIFEVKHQELVGENEELRRKNFEGQERLAQIEANQSLEIARLRAENNSQKVIEENEALKLKIEEAQQKLAQLENEHRVETTALWAQIEDLKNCENKFQSSIEENEDLRLKIVESRERLALVDGEHQVETTALWAQIEDLKNSENDNRKAIEENEDLRLKIVEAQERLALVEGEHRVEITALWAQIEDLKNSENRLQTLIEENEDLKSKTAEGQTRLAQLETDRKTESDELRRKIAEGHERLGRIKTGHSETSALLTEKSRTVAELLATNDALKTRLAELETVEIDNRRLGELETRFRRLANEHETSRAKNEAEINELRDRNAQISTDYKEILAENEKASTELEEVKLRAETSGDSALRRELKTLRDLSANFEAEKRRLEGQLNELDQHYGELKHEKQLLEDEVQELKISPIGSEILTNGPTELKSKQEEIDHLNDKLTQYKSLDLTNRSSLQFYENELQKLKNTNEKLGRKLDETLVTLGHCTELANSTELEYLRNVLYNYMLGKESMVLARVIAAVCKFDKEQTEAILQKEQHKQTLLGHLGIL